MAQNIFMRKSAAFGLIELIIVLAIIGILAAISYPMYREHIIKTRRLRTVSMLINLAAKMEEYYLEKHSYKNIDISKYILKQEHSFYKIKVDITSDNAFLIKAVPNILQADKKCSVLSINQRGERFVNGDGGVAECWY